MTYVMSAVMNLKFVNMTIGRELDVSRVGKRQQERKRERRN